MRYRDPRVWMLADACELLERAERLQRRFFEIGGEASKPAWQPPLDIFETPEELWIHAALPGVAPDDVQVAISGGTLIVMGERTLPPEARASYIHRVEIPHGRFERRIQLPAGRFELERRDLINGCLILSLRKLD